MEQINLEVLDGVLDRYQAHLKETRKEEIYKWEAVRHFKETYDPWAERFGEMIEDAYSANIKLNITWGRTWFPVGMLGWFGDIDREGTLAALDALYDESIDLKARMVAFEAWAKGMLDRINVDKAAHGQELVKSHFQDSRSMSVYLAFTHPETHYLYKNQDVS